MLAYGLEVFWFVIVITAVSCYAMLDGFDLGVGILHLLARKDEERRIFLNAIGPVWDGNEVWLVIVVGGLFAGFPLAYATLFSAFYMPLACLVAGLIFRAVAIEFRSKLLSPIWRTIWDVLFSLASLFIAFVVGIALGNLVQGIPLNENHDYVGSVVASFFHPYPLLVGVLAVSLFMMHGAIYLVMKTEGALQEKLKTWVGPTAIFFILTYVVTTLTTLLYQDHMAARLKAHPYLFILVLLNVLVIANIPREITRKKYGFAFLSSCANVALLMVLYAVGNFPHLVRSSINPEINSLTITNSSASVTTLKILAVIVAIGIPLVLAYGFYIYHIFRGKVKLDSMSY